MANNRARSTRAHARAAGLTYVSDTWRELRKQREPLASVRSRCFRCSRHGPLNRPLQSSLSVPELEALAEVLAR